MTRKTSIALFYTGVAAISAAIVGIAFYLRSQLPQPDLSIIVNAGKETPAQWFEIKKDIAGYNQEGKAVKLSDLRGKVVLIAEFFAVCPHCAVRNGEELRKIYDAFRNEPDFQILCISVDPENDNRERLADYAQALGAETKNWWFINAGDAKTTHTYLEKELGFMGIRERKDPADIETNGRYAHDMSFLLVNRDAYVLGKWPLADARSPEALKREPARYSELSQQLFERIRTELQHHATPANPK